MSEAATRAKVCHELHAARDRSGLTQARLASHVGTSASRFSTYLTGSTVPSAVLYLQILEVADAFERMRSRGRMTPDSTADVVDAALARGDEDLAVRLVLQARDDLRAELAGDGAAAARIVWGARSRPLGDERLDILLRAVVEHELHPDAPEWAVGARLRDEWLVPDPFRNEAEVRAQTPKWLADAGILLAARGLVTA